MRPAYCIGGLLIAAGLLVLLIAELIAWKNGVSGDTISETMWEFNIPGFLYFTAAGAIASFVFALTVHFVAKGKWGL